MYSIEFYLVCLAFNAIGSILDIISSQDFPRYNMREVTAYKRRADGSLNTGIDAVQLAVQIAIQSVLFFAIGGDIGFAANVLFAGFGFIRIILALLNWSKKARNKRTKIANGTWK